MLAALPSPSSRATAFTRMTTGNATLMAAMAVIPTALTLMVNCLYNIVDQIFVGQGVGMA